MIRNGNNVAILAGGTSQERVISLLSAEQLQKWLTGTPYTPYIIDIQGASWTYTLPDGRCVQVDKNTFSLPLPEGTLPLDLAFISTHGTPGENGLLQGYLELMNIPFSSGNTFTQAVSFHKSACKRFLQGVVPLLPSLDIHCFEELDLEAIRREIGFPLFVKPNDNGSSVGVKKVRNGNELHQAVRETLEISSDVMLERFCPGIELSCGMVKIGNRVTSFPVAEIVSPSEFFDFKTKYDGSSQEIVPARIPLPMSNLVQQYTAAAYERLGCRGMARADFILHDGTPYFLEINTCPGLTAESIVPKQVRALGREMSDVLVEILDAMRR